jgi:hypothetical protein
VPRLPLDAVFLSPTTPPPHRYMPFLTTRRLRLLGRDLPLSSLLSSRLASLSRASLESAISRFEAKGLAGAAELYSAITCSQLAHGMLKAVAPEMDAWEAVQGEADEGVGLLSFHTRVGEMTVREVMQDVNSLSFVGGGGKGVSGGEGRCGARRTKGWRYSCSHTRGRDDRVRCDGGCESRLWREV